MSKAQEERIARQAAEIARLKVELAKKDGPRWAEVRAYYDGLRKKAREYEDYSDELGKAAGYVQMSVK